MPESRVEQQPERIQHYYTRALDGTLRSVIETLAYDVDTRVRIVLSRRSETVEHDAEKRMLEQRLALFQKRVVQTQARLEALAKV